MDNRVKDLICKMKKDHGKRWAFHLLLEFEEMGQGEYLDNAQDDFYLALSKWIEDRISASDWEVS